MVLIDGSSASKWSALAILTCNGTACSFPCYRRGDRGSEELVLPTSMVAGKWCRRCHGRRCHSSRRSEERRRLPIRRSTLHIGPNGSQSSSSSDHPMGSCWPSLVSRYHLKKHRGARATVKVFKYKMEYKLTFRLTNITEKSSKR